MHPRTLTGAIAGALALAAATTATAAPVTVDVRVEGRTQTLLERTVTVDVRPFKYSDDPQLYTCNGTSSNGGPSPAPVPTRSGALAQAAEETATELTGTYFDGFGPGFDRVAGEDVSYDQTTMSYLAEFQNGRFDAELGGCARQVAQGDDVLFAYGNGSEQVLALAGPTTIRPGERATLTVTDAEDGSAVAGASVAGGTTGSDGRTTTPALTQRGPQTFKATRAAAIRSNAATVCVTDGADGFCGTTAPGQTQSTTAAPAPAPSATQPATSSPAAAALPDTLAAFAKVGSIREGQRFARGRGPRTLAGTVDTEASGLKDVRIRLTRTSGGRCFRFDGTRERFVATRRCGIRNARTFSVGAAPAFSYLLPAALPSGRYVLDVVVLDRAKNQTLTYQRGRNRVVFTVG